MDWWIIGGLVIVVVALVSVYRISVRESRELTHYLLMLILGDDLYRAARINLSNFVASADAKNAAQLSSLVFMAAAKSAANMEKHSLFQQLIRRKAIGEPMHLTDQQICHLKDVITYSSAIFAILAAGWWGRATYWGWFDFLHTGNRSNRDVYEVAGSL